METLFSQFGDKFLLHAKEIHKSVEDTVKQCRAEERARIELLDKDILKLKKESKALGIDSKSKLEELESSRELSVQYLKDTKLPKLIDSVKDCGANFEKHKKDILEEIKGEPEERFFNIVLSNLEKFIPKKRTPQEELDATNLLRSIITLHGIGKGVGGKSEKDRTIRTASKVSKKVTAGNIKEYEISRYVHAIIKQKNKDAEHMCSFIKKYRSEYIKWDGKKYILMKRATRDLKPETLLQFDHEIQLTRPIVNEKKVWEETYEKEIGKKPDKQAYYRHTQRIF
jgi:translation initiation factor 2 beta subunit (eIF-2beta)/eIF-5